MEIRTIGVVRSPVSEARDDNWGEVISEIHLQQELAPGLQGLDQFSHIIVVFFMHQATFDEATDLIRRPRGRVDMPELGIFAQRARHRPSPIGITAVALLSVAGAVLRVKGMDAIDQTPVLDIKPYVAAFDRVAEPRMPEWIERLMQDYF